MEVKTEWVLSPEEDSLFDAACRNAAGSVQRALRNGADVNCIWQRGDYDATPLFEVCREGFADIARILLDAGANARYRTIRDCSPIQRACAYGHLSIVKMLINHDKDLLEIEDKRGCTPLFDAIDHKHLDVVRFLLDRGASVHKATHSGTTTLMRACREGNLAIVRLFLTAGLNVEARDNSKQTALHYAAECRSAEIFRELTFQHNANMFAMDRKGKTPFDLICGQTFHHIVDQFLAIYSNKMIHNHGRLALHTILGAAEYTYIENQEFHPPLKPLLQICLPLGKLFLKQFRSLLSTFDTNLIRDRDENGKLPIHIACRNNAPMEVHSLLIEIDAATLHIADYTGTLPIHECCCGVVDDSSVQFLVEQGGVGTLATRTREGALPLHVLCESLNPSVRTVQYMVQSFPGSVAARTNAGQYPFVIAAYESSTASLSVVYELVRANPDLVISN